MDTLRERHFSRHGMGHANRSWQHHIVSLDSQPGSVCLSPPRRRQSNPNTDRLANSDCNSNTNRDRSSKRDTDCNGDAHGNNNTGEADTDPQTSANAEVSLIQRQPRR
jgi:hypothetical protein